MATITETFTIRGDAPVSLSVTIGDGQIGGYNMILDSKALEPTRQDEKRAEYALGPGEGLRYCNLIGTVLVKDVNPGVDRTTVTVKLSQAGKTTEHTQTEDAIANGTVAYGIAIWFE